MKHAMQRIQPGAVFLAAVLMVQLAAGGAARAEEETGKKTEKPVPTYNVAFVDKAPKLDGVLDDACWKKTDVAGDFRTTLDGKTKATPPTEVRLVYDYRYLYIAYKFFEPDMPGIKAKADAPGKQVWKDDCAEIFFFFNGSSYQLMVNSLAITQQSRNRKGWNPRWEAAAKTYKDHWIVEARIPFSGFSGGKFPTQGTKWKANFARDRYKNLPIAPTARIVHGDDVIYTYKVWTLVGTSAWASLRWNLRKHEKYGWVHFTGKELFTGEVRNNAPSATEVKASLPVNYHVARVAQAPEIDGKLDDACWAKLKTITGFTLTSDGTSKADPQTEVKVGFDDKFLYICYKLHEPEMDSLRANVKDQDGGVWKDDCGEIFFLIEDDKPGNYHQLILNSLGTKEEHRDKKAWAPKWTAAAKKFKDYWAFELRIAFSELGGRTAPKPGTRWLANFARDRFAKKAQTSSWSNLRGTLHNSSAFKLIGFGMPEKKGK